MSAIQTRDRHSVRNHAMSTLTASTQFDSTPTVRTCPTGGFVSAAPKVILRVEGALVLAAACAAYARFGGGWGLFALMFLTPDLSMLGYLAGRKVGAVGYNIGHSYILPTALGATGIVLAQPLLVSLALIWIAHIGFDRMLGYGLKYPTAFGHTHLGVVGALRRA